MNTMDPLFDDISQKLSALKSDVEIPEAVQSEYISCHDFIDTDQYDSDEIERQGENLFDESIPDDEKKKILFLLAHMGTAPSVRMLERYAEMAPEAMKGWAVLALEEGWMSLENEAMGTEQIKILSGAGGDGERLRYFFVISARKPITEEQFDVFEGAFMDVANDFSVTVEATEKGDLYALASVLAPMDVAIGDFIETGIRQCNKYARPFLRSHYFVTNTKKPSKADIDEYLHEL